LTASTSRQNLQRVGPLALVPEILRSFGVEPCEALAAAKLEEHALDNPEGTIPYTAMGLLVEWAAEKTGCAHFGLEVGQRIKLASLGILGELLRHAPTLRAALNTFCANQHRNAHGAVMYLLETDGKAFFGYAVYQPGVRGNNLICEGAVAGGYNVVSELAGVEYASRLSVVLSRTEPKDLKPYQRLFGTKLSFDQEQSAVVIPGWLLDQPIKGADDAMRIRLEDQVRDHWNAGIIDTETKLRRALRIGLLQGDVSVTAIATHLGMGRRTFDRELFAMKLRFTDVLDETRCELAQQLLANTRLNLTAISTILGYADPSVFTRVFTRWTGAAPSKWRKAQAL
jgi:AraC-like DNA-binding protein